MRDGIDRVQRETHRLVPRVDKHLGEFQKRVGSFVVYHEYGSYSLEAEQKGKRKQEQTDAVVDDHLIEIPLAELPEEVEEGVDIVARKEVVESEELGRHCLTFGPTVEPGPRVLDPGFSHHRVDAINPFATTNSR